MTAIELSALNLNFKSRRLKLNETFCVFHHTFSTVFITFLHCINYTFDIDNNNNNNNNNDNNSYNEIMYKRPTFQWWLFLYI